MSEWGRFDIEVTLAHLMIAEQCFQFQRRTLSIFLKQCFLIDESAVKAVLIVNSDLILLLNFKVFQVSLLFSFCAHSQRFFSVCDQNFTHQFFLVTTGFHRLLFRSLRISHKFFKLHFFPSAISDSNKLNKHICNSDNISTF